MQEACAFGRQLADQGRPDIYVAVNVSPLQLGSDDFVDNIRNILNQAQVDPRQIELEITESALIGSLAESIDKLRELQALGLRLALDDFGTGYSSLTYLQQLPVETLKIDKSFIDTILVGDSRKSIIGTIVDMAHIMAMTVVAEGGEQEPQITFLAACCCDRFQGYVFSRPVPEAEAIGFLTGGCQTGLS